jgi:hypothetical protein
MKPSWTPDGTHLVYEQGLSIVVADGDGDNPRPIDTPPLTWAPDSPSLSPDGTRVVFSGDAGHLYVASTSSNEVHQITGSPQRDVHPAWSPRGDVIVFDRLSDVGRPELYEVGPTGGDRQITFGGVNVYSSAPSWSPDGSKIAFIEQTYKGTHIAVTNPDGSDTTAISPEFQGLFGYAAPAWSPDGSRVAFAETPNRVDVIGVNRQNWSTLIDNTTNEVTGIAWRPSGSGVTVGLDDLEFVVPRREFKLTGNVRSIGDLPAAGLSVTVDAGSARIAAITLPGATCTATGSKATCTAAAVPGDTTLPLTVTVAPTRPGPLSVQLTGTAANDANHLDDTASAQTSVSACTVLGTDGNDHLVAHGGDVVCAGRGNDTIDARNGKVDTIDGGPGVDTATVDASDHVRHVEHVHRPKKRSAR